MKIASCSEKVQIYCEKGYNELTDTINTNCIATSEKQ